jgi:hypothetical protein
MTSPVKEEDDDLILFCYGEVKIGLVCFEAQL